MARTAIIKWIGTIFLGGILLVLALMGGNWGSSYAAVAGDCPVPYITYINPSSVKTGSLGKTIVISGGNFGTPSDTFVWFDSTILPDLLPPTSVLPDGTGISVFVPTFMLAVDNNYAVKIVKSCPHTIPTIPTLPDWDVVSTSKPFVIYTPFDFYLPIISR
jgi:hypothetical protein